MRGVCAVLLLCLIAPAVVLADGMVVPQIAHPVVIIPDQRAIIIYGAGVERLMIDTAFQGEGTNFAWIVPLPAAPQIEEAAPQLFDSVRATFEPRLRHRIHRWYLPLLVLSLTFYLARA